MSQSCLCELINTGMCDGAKKQVICPSHPSNRSTPYHSAAYLRVWGWLWLIGHFFYGLYEAFVDLMRKWHVIHTWGLWENLRRAYPVAYPWTKAGCYAHFVQEQTRACETCGKREHRDRIF